QITAIPGEQAEVVPRPCHALRVASPAEVRLRPLVPAGRRLPLAAGPGNMPEKGARNRRTAHIVTPLAAVKRLEQEVLGTARLPGRPGQNSPDGEHAVQATRRGIVAVGCR